MQLEVGAIVEGKVTGITNFGAFVELPGGKTGMVHISEVSNSYVKEISDHLSENQMVRVKILKISPDGKISLSIKKCMENQQPQSDPQDQSRSQAPRKNYPRKDMGWQGIKKAPEGGSFEEMLARFKQASEDKMSDLKRSVDIRKSSRRGQYR
ncbi:MAG TPA: S1 RNA-binding domain-containing protein [Clostridiales bacterium]|nr:S1 RNA-binding domain-containing protein [Clostridiales bacterium]